MTRSEGHAQPPTACRHVVSGISFTPRTGVLFTCPSRYSFTIGHTGVFSLGGWSPQLHARLLVARALLRNSTSTSIWPSPTGLSPSMAPRSRGLRLHLPCRPWVLQPRQPQGARFRLGPFRSPLLRASRLISLPPGTEMFQFPRFALALKTSDGARAPPGFPIRPSRDHSVCAAPPGLSQLTTAFIASVCPGIPHMPSLA